MFTDEAVITPSGKKNISASSFFRQLQSGSQRLTDKRLHKATEADKERHIQSTHLHTYILLHYLPYCYPNNQIHTYTDRQTDRQIITEPLICSTDRQTGRPIYRQSAANGMFCSLRHVTFFPRVPWGVRYLHNSRQGPEGARGSGIISFDMAPRADWRQVEKAGK